MLSIPLQVSEDEFDLVLVIGDDNLERMRAHDPGVVETDLMGAPWTALRLRRLYLAYGDAAEFATLAGMAANHAGGHELMTFITRGFQFRPELGDSSAPYVSLTPKPN